MRRKEVIADLKADLGECRDEVYLNEWNELAAGWDHPWADDPVGDRKSVV